MTLLFDIIFSLYFSSFFFSNFFVKDTEKLNKIYSEHLNVHHETLPLTFYYSLKFFLLW